MANEIMEPIPVRYEGIDAADHEIELGLLGESLIGVSRIISVCANFVVTGEYKFHYDSQQIRVVTKEPQAKCFELLAFIKAVSQHPIFQGLAGSVVAAIVAYIVAKKSKEPSETEKRLFALESQMMESGMRDREVVMKMLSVIEKMADDLHPALKQAVAPINVTCETLQIGRHEYHPLLINPERKRRILEEGPIEFGDEEEFHVFITEFDKENATCKVRFSRHGEEKRIPGSVADPSGKIIDDPYSLAMARAEEIKVLGKLEFQDGEIKRLHILAIRP
jgi:hypothetical protein